MKTAKAVVDFPVDRLTKTIPCGKCGREMTVSDRTLLAYCAGCSATLGDKR